MFINIRCLMARLPPPIPVIFPLINLKILEANLNPDISELLK